ncbi:mannose-1-phosphate guanylyltransferase/mannose-6-phosphate isomerase [Archaeoglobus sp.]
MKVLILAGGVGERLFPLSRLKYPKQFLRLNGESLFQKTVKRGLMLSDYIYVVTNVDHAFMIERELDELGVKAKILTEPMPKNTLPAIYLGIKEIVKDFGKSKVAVLPSDHLIEANEKYLSAFKIAEKLSDKFLVTFGIKPTKPHTGYGYIKPRESVNGAFVVEKFVEKPDYETAKMYVENGYLWNSGMFVFDSEIFFEECEKFAKDVMEKVDEGRYEDIESISVDKGILEKSDRVAVVPLDVFWSDVGSFDAIYEIMEKDESGNAVKGEFLGVDSNNNLIIGDGLVTAVDVENMVIVNTKDVTLVCPRESSQKVREIVRALRKRSDERAEHHITVYRPWGSYTVLEEGNGYKVKRLTVLPGKRLSLQMHYHRNEFWVVVKGTAKVTVDDREFLLRKGESTFIPIGAKHRLENPGKVTLEVIEVQIGEYLGEDDIVRFADDFGRV